MRVARSTVLVGIALAGWAVAIDVAYAQSLAPNRSGFGSWTRRSVSTPSGGGYTRTVTRGGSVRSGGGGTAGAAGAAVGAARFAIGVVGAAASNMPGESRTDVPAWPPPASCARRYAGSWLVNYAGQTYTATINANGTGTAHCPFCMPSQRWTCRGNEYFLLDPVIITMRMSPDGQSWTSANGSGRRISPGQTQVASASGASRPPGASDTPGASGPGVAYAPGQTYLPRSNTGSASLNTQYGRQHNCGSDITGTGGTPMARSAQCRRGNTRLQSAYRQALTPPLTRTAEGRRQQLVAARQQLLQAVRDFQQARDLDSARIAQENADSIQRVLQERGTVLRPTGNGMFVVRREDPGTGGLTSQGCEHLQYTRRPGGGIGPGGTFCPGDTASSGGGGPPGGGSGSGSGSGGSGSGGGGGGGVTGGTGWTAECLLILEQARRRYRGVPSADRIRHINWHLQRSGCRQSASG